MGDIRGYGRIGGGYTRIKEDRWGCARIGENSWGYARIADSSNHV